MKKRSRSFIIVVILLLCFTINIGKAQVYKTIDVATPGTLSSLLTADELNLTTDFTITGAIDADDFNTMKSQMPALNFVDLSAVTVVGDSVPGLAFSNKLDITEIILPASIKRIGEYAFGHSGLVSITLPASLDSIGVSAFQGCSGLTSISIPSSVDYIGDGAFSGCSALTDITIPSSITAINDYTFFSCGNLTSINIPPSVTTIGHDAFVSCRRLTSISIPSSVTSIGMQAFCGCDSITSIFIPSSVGFIGARAFYGAGVKNFSVDESSFYFSSLEGVLFNKDKTILVQYPLMKMDSIYIIPSSVLSLSDNCFGLSGFKGIYIPSSVDTIGSYTFNTCYNLKFIKVLRSEPLHVNFGDEVFGSTLYENCTLYVPTGSMGDYSTWYPWNGFDHIVEFPLVLSLSQNQLIIADTSGSSAMFDINSTLAWHVSSNQSWLVPNILSGMDSCTVTLTAEANPTSAVRKATITVTPVEGASPKTITVQQSEYQPTLSVSPGEFVIADTAGSMTTITINSTRKWNVSSNQPWLVPNPEAGSDTSIIAVTAEANPTSAMREAIITVSSDDGLTVIAVTVQQLAMVSSIIYVTFYSQIHIYPTAVYDVLHIEGAANRSVQFYSIQGMLLISKKIVEASETLDLSTLSRGVYLLKIEGEKGCVKIGKL